MTVFVDTSAFFAVLDADDDNHARARQIWLDFLEQGENLITNNYVLVETSALLQSRLGVKAIRIFSEKIVPVMTVDWLNADQHQNAVAALLTAGRRNLSLVDCSSFDTMRRQGIQDVFTFDSHFLEQGFDCIS
jgi:predicted nucleic acid-binding protein